MTEPTEPFEYPDLVGIKIMEAQDLFKKLDAYMAKQSPFVDKELADGVVDVHRAAMAYLEAIELLMNRTVL